MPPVLSSKHALLIGCPRDLKGTEADIEMMRDLLGSSGFGFDIQVCYGANSTRNGILDAIGELQKKVTDEKRKSGIESIVVIYYSGHGGIVEASEASGTKTRRYQYLVPSDYGSNETKFNVILDSELSLLLNSMTHQTTNVTVIFDCCHSGRMARIQPHENMSSRKVPPINVSQLQDHVKRLLDGGMRLKETPLEGNPNVVRIMSAAPTEVSWEFDDEDGICSGVMTRSLVKALRASKELGLSWNTIMTRVIQMVTTEEPSQHPCAEGPSTRVLFTTRNIRWQSHSIKMERGAPIIEAGRVSGVGEGNVYTIMPHNYDEPNVDNSIGKVVVNAVQALRSRANFTETIRGRTIGEEGALAFLYQETSRVWVVEYPHDMQDLLKALQSSKFLQPRGKASRELSLTNQDALVNHERAIINHELALSQLELAIANHELASSSSGLHLAMQELGLADFKQKLARHRQALANYKVSLTENPLMHQSNSELDTPALVEIKQIGDNLCLYKNGGLMCCSVSVVDLGLPEASKRVAGMANQIARAQHLLGLPNGIGKEELKPDILSIEFGLAVDKKRKQLPASNAEVKIGDQFYFDMKNSGDRTVYVSVFGVDVVGGVSHITSSWPTGVEIEAKGSYIIGKSDWGADGDKEVEGIPFMWAEYAPKTTPVTETAVFIMTSEKVDLRHFVDKVGRGRSTDADSSTLEQLAYQLSQGLGRTMGSEQRRRSVGYAVVRVPYLLSPFP
ncbi:hypothetical protein O1611_g1933 [Lasiodiplodia mahajangana]|uniref:Uncharacterized protein n=1 Tax=Lasiodiplodia mahajangana TaxID=1108764 RepID=A0ACC2JW16_9PEZI|nr:hypothetical protein O1611_g1933 [Lasiodiplodia mahajangana]